MVLRVTPQALAKARGSRLSLPWSSQPVQDLTQIDAEKLRRSGNQFSKKIAVVLAGAQRVESCNTPNGLIVESPLGWVLTMCCLEGAALPHFIGLRGRRPAAEHVIRAYEAHGGYVIRAEGVPPDCNWLAMREIMNCLGYKPQTKSARDLRYWSTDHFK